MKSKRDLNLLPIESETNVRVEISTKLPDTLIGSCLLRNGPNSQFQIGNEKDHLFDGDGMIHCIKFEKDSILYHNRWIRTYRFLTEKKHQMRLFSRIGCLNVFEIILNFIKKWYFTDDFYSFLYGEGTANTNVIAHAGKIFALNEMDLPYELKFRNGSLETVGRHDFNRKLQHNVNAHPKIDNQSKDLIILGYDVLWRMCYISLINSEGILHKTYSIELEGPVIIHDLGITEDFFVLLHMPLTFSIRNVMLCKFPMEYQRGTRCKIGLVSKRNGSVMWFNIPQDEIIFHMANCWQGNDAKVVIYAFCYAVETFDILRIENEEPVLKKFVLDLDLSSVIVEVKSRFYGEFPVIEQEFVGVPCPYIYYSRVSNNTISGIIKHNTISSREDLLDFPDGVSGGECSIKGDYIVCIGFIAETYLSVILVYDKHALKLVNKINLPFRIPSGFHGGFINV